MLHRDINPDNVHITQDRQVKILDFGMALVLGTRASSAMEDEVSAVGGRSGYAPVEQFMRHGQQGPWTDVYALGATIYRAITGQVPSAP
jgi:serine/threonine protein kinase